MFLARDGGGQIHVDLRVHATARGIVHAGDDGHERWFRRARVDRVRHLRLALQGGGHVCAPVDVNFAGVRRERGPARHRPQPALLRLLIEARVHDADTRGGHQDIPELARGQPGGDVGVEESFLELDVWPRKVSFKLVLDDEALQVLLVLLEARHVTAERLGARVPRVVEPRLGVVAALRGRFVCTHGLVFGLHAVLELEKRSRARASLDKDVVRRRQFLRQPDAHAPVFLHGVDERDPLRVRRVVAGDGVERDDLGSEESGARDLDPRVGV